MQTPGIAFMLIAAALYERASASLPLSQAIQQKKVNVVVKTYSSPSDSNYHPSYYKQCMQFEVKNLTASTLILQENAGRFLMPDDSATQRMMLTSSVTFALKAGEKKSIPLYAMCTEAHDGAPQERDNFTYGKFAEGKLKELASFIDAKNFQNEAGQEAVWSVTDDYSPYSINDNDTAVMYALRRYVCALKGINYDPRVQTEYEASPLTREVHGTFYYSISRNEKITVKIFTGNEKLIKTIVDGEMQNAGTHNYEYDTSIPVDNSSSAPVIILRFYVNDRLFAERRHQLSKW